MCTRWTKTFVVKNADPTPGLFSRAPLNICHCCPHWLNQSYMQNHGVNTLGYRCLQPSWKRFSPQFNQSEGEWACVRRLLTSPLPPSLASRWQCRACIFSCKAVSLSFGAVQFKVQCSSQEWSPGRCREGQCNGHIFVVHHWMQFTSFYLALVSGGTIGHF